jgi:hypothetical protein
MPGQDRRVKQLFAIGALILAASLSACAGSGGVGSSEGVSGDEHGGKVPYQEGAVSSAMSAAQAHCAKFGKKAQVTQMNPSADGGQIGFLCS